MVHETCVLVFASSCSVLVASPFSYVFYFVLVFTNGKDYITSLEVEAVLLNYFFYLVYIVLWCWAMHSLDDISNN